MGIYGLGWGVVIGAGLHLLLQIPALLKVHGKYSFTVGLDMPDVGEVIRLMGPRLLGVAVVQLNFWINTRLASQFAEGSVTGIVLGFTLMLMPQAAIAQSIAIAALPSFSAQVAQGRLNEMRFSLGIQFTLGIDLIYPCFHWTDDLATPDYPVALPARSIRRQVDRAGCLGALVVCRRIGWSLPWWKFWREHFIRCMILGRLCLLVFWR